MKLSHLTLSHLTLSFFLTSCMVGPNYHPPLVIIPDTWNCPCDAITTWWEEFQDALLNKYIVEAAIYNQDVLQAEAAICQARAMRQISRSKLFPQINADLNALRIDFSKNGPLIGVGQPVAGSLRRRIENIYTCLLDASWEIDLFGKIRRQVEVANANIGVATEHKNDVLISVFAEVARNYIDLRSAQQRRLLQEQNVSLLEAEIKLVREQVEKGLVNLLVLENKEADLAKLKAAIPPVIAEIYQYIYGLSVLTGSLPEALLEELEPPGCLPKAPLEIACGVRSDLLRRRPDIREVERNLAAATANIGVAVASFFPSLTLFGAIGFQSFHLNNLFQAGSKTWFIGGNGSMPIFQGGNLVGNLRLSESQAVQAGIYYQQTILKALEEAESTLVAYHEALVAQRNFLESVKKVEDLDSLTRKRYTEGLVDMSKTLESARTLNNSLLDLIQSETTVLLDAVALYKALGGGWEPIPCP